MLHALFDMTRWQRRQDGARISSYGRQQVVCQRTELELRHISVSVAGKQTKARARVKDDLPAREMPGARVRPMPGGSGHPASEAGNAR